VFLQVLLFGHQGGIELGACLEHHLAGGVLRLGDDLLLSCLRLKTQLGCFGEASTPCFGQGDLDARKSRRSVGLKLRRLLACARYRISRGGNS